MSNALVEYELRSRWTWQDLGLCLCGVAFIASSFLPDAPLAVIVTAWVFGGGGWSRSRRGRGSRP